MAWIIPGGSRTTSLGKAACRVNFGPAYLRVSDTQELLVLLAIGEFRHEAQVFTNE